MVLVKVEEVEEVEPVTGAQSQTGLSIQEGESTIHRSFEMTVHQVLPRV